VAPLEAASLNSTVIVLFTDGFARIEYTHFVGPRTGPCEHVIEDPLVVRTAVALGGHLKTGHTWSLQNRP